MLSVYKYTLKVTERQILETQSTNILSVKVQNKNEIVVYALVDTDSPMHKYEFNISGTGHPIDVTINKFDFLGTVEVYDSLMFHVFYRYATVPEYKESKESLLWS